MHSGAAKDNATNLPFISGEQLMDCSVRLNPYDEFSSGYTVASAADHARLSQAVVRESNLYNSLTSTFAGRRSLVQKARDELRTMTKDVLANMLVEEWKTEDQDVANVQIYLIDNVLPSIVLGLEKLLTEVEKRHLVNKEGVDFNFNPINFLAHFLMQNNPKYSNLDESSPYVRGLRRIVEHLKLELFHLTDNQ